MILKNEQDIYPWQQQQWEQFTKQWQTQRLSHAYLLVGAKGMGKIDFAQHLAMAVLCQNKQGQFHPCKQCKSCLLINAQTHADIKLISPETNTIKVDQIRECNEFFTQSSLMNSYKIAIIYPAEAMNTAAANALLKTLEEPGTKQSLLLLVSVKPNLLPATIISRCQQIKFMPPKADSVKHWLQKRNYTYDQNLLELVHYAPLKYLEYQQKGIDQQCHALLTDILQLSELTVDPITLAKKWMSEELKQVLSWQLFWLYRISQVKQGIVINITNPETKTNLQILSQNIITTSLYELLDILTENLKLLEDRINLNQQILLETLFTHWLGAIKHAG